MLFACTLGVGGTGFERAGVVTSQRRNCGRGMKTAISPELNGPSTLGHARDIRLVALHLFVVSQLGATNGCCGGWGGWGGTRYREMLLVRDQLHRVVVVDNFSMGWGCCCGCGSGFGFMATRSPGGGPGAGAGAFRVWLWLRSRSGSQLPRFWCGDRRCHAANALNANDLPHRPRC